MKGPMDNVGGTLELWWQAVPLKHTNISSLVN